MKLTKSALSMLLQAYRAILKASYMRGLAGAAVLTAGIFSMAASAAAISVTADNLHEFISAHEEGNTSNDLSFAAEDAYQAGTIHNTAVNISGTFNIADYEFTSPGADIPQGADNAKVVSGFNAAGVDVNGDYPLQDETVVIANAAVNLQENTSFTGIDYNYGDAGSGRTYFLAAGVWDGGSGGSSINISNAAVNVAPGVKLDTVQLAGAVFDMDSRADLNGQAVNGTVAGSINFADAAADQATVVNNAYIAAACAEEDDITADIQDDLTVNGSVYVGQNVTITGLDYEADADRDHDIVIGAYNLLGGAANGSVVINGSIKNAQVGAAAGTDSDINGSVVIGESGALIMDNQILEGDNSTTVEGIPSGKYQDMQLSAVSSSGKGGTLVGNVEIYGQYGSTDAVHAADIRLMDTEYFEHASAVLVINQSAETAAKSKIAAVNVFDISSHENEDGVGGNSMPFTAENSINSTAEVNVTIDGHSKVETLNLMYIGSNSVYAGTLDGTVTVGQDASVDTINGIAAEGSLADAFAGNNNVIRQDYHIYGTVNTLNVFGADSAAAGGAAGASRFSALTASFDSERPQIVTSINLYNTSLANLNAAAETGVDSVVNINSTGNSEISTIANGTQIGAVAVDAVGADPSKALLTVNNGLTADSITITTNGQQLDNAINAGANEIKTSSLTVKANTFVQNTYSKDDGSEFSLGQQVAVDSDLEVSYYTQDSADPLLLAEQSGITMFQRTTAGAKILAEAMAGTAALINQGAEFVAADGLDAAAAAAARSAGHNSAFGALQAGYNEYATGSEVDLTSVTGVAGFAKGFSFGNDMLTAAVFLDLGSGSSDLYAGGYDGDADHEYYGIGAAVRYAFESGFFLDGSLRGGRTETDFNGRMDGTDIDYDSDAEYFGAHIGAGFVFDLTDSLTLTPYVRGTYSYIGDDSVHTADGSSLDLDSINAFGLQAGADLGYELNDLLTLKGGLGYIGVWNGDADGEVENLSIDTASIEGNTGMARIGLQLAPQGSGFSLNIGAGGYAGDRKGGMGSLMVNYAF